MRKINRVLLLGSGEPSTRKSRRMGVALARGKNADAARKLARETAAKLRIVYS